ncbi:MAG: serine aminopeptidase domain-containing protein [Gemmataceae bacterium]
MKGETCLHRVLAVILWLSGCAVVGASAPLAATVPSCARPGIVFVADGAGGFEGASRYIRRAAAEEKLPLDVRTFHWTHGYLRIVSDEIHAAHAQREGQKLADLVLSCRHEAPDVPIYLIGHSAGCGVILNAAEHLPPNVVERIVMLAPAVSVHRDLRPALRSSCQGIDAFISNHDWICLGLATSVAGTADRRWRTGAAGKIGFQPAAVEPGEEALYDKLRQYPWDSSQMWTGHKGGHYGSYQPGFLRTFVFPLLQ